MRLTAFIIGTCAAALLFVLFPDLDIAFSRLFHRAGDGFFLRDWGPVTALYQSIEILTPTVIGGVIGLALLRLVPPLARLHVRYTVLAYVALSFALGPGIVSNVILKDNIGRARPAQTVEFGGEARFSPALMPADQCEKNCAFVSGHAATGFFLATFAFLLAPGGPRRAALAAAVLFGALVGLGRIAQGAHWLSDIVFAGIINTAIAWGLYEWIIRGDGFARLARSRPARRAAEGLRALARRPAVSRLALGLTGPLGRHLAILGWVMLLAVLSYAYVDRPAALWFRSFDIELHLAIRSVADIGDSVYWLVPFLAGYVVLRLASRHARLREIRDRLKAWATVSLFLFTTVAVTGVAAKLLKIAFGRYRPKYIFDGDGSYGFGWFQLDAGAQSFPSGHAVTIVALMTALYFILPRYLGVFVVVGGIIALARVAEAAHYLSDILVGGYLAILMTAWVRMVFLRSGIDVAMAAAGRLTPREKAPWPERLGVPPRLVAALARRPGAGKGHAPPPP